MQIEIEIPKLTGDTSTLDASDKIAAIAYYDAVRSAAGTSGAARHSEIAVVRYVDKASPVLAQACGAGTSLGKVKIKHFRNTDTGQEEYARFILVDAYVSRYTRATLDSKGVALGPQYGYHNDVPSWRGLAAEIAASSGETEATAKAKASPLPMYDGQVTGFLNKEVEHLWFSGTQVGWYNTGDSVLVAWDINNGTSLDDDLDSD